MNIPPEAIAQIKQLQQQEVMSAERLAHAQTAITQKAYQRSRARGFHQIIGQVDPDLDKASGAKYATARNLGERGAILKIARNWAIYSIFFTVALALVTVPVLYSLAIAIFSGAIASLITY